MSGNNERETENDLMTPLDWGPLHQVRVKQVFLQIGVVNKAWALEPRETCSSPKSPTS